MPAHSILPVMEIIPLSSISMNIYAIFSSSLLVTKLLSLSDQCLQQDHSIVLICSIFYLMVTQKQISDAGNLGVTNRRRILIFSEDVKASLKSKEKTRVVTKVTTI